MPLWIGIFLVLIVIINTGLWGLPKLAVKWEELDENGA